MKKILKFLKNKIIPLVCICSIILSILCISVSAEEWTAGDREADYPDNFDGVLDDSYATYNPSTLHPYSFDFTACFPLIDIRSPNTRSYVPFYQTVKDVGYSSRMFESYRYIYDNSTGEVLSSTSVDLSGSYMNGFSYYHWYDTFNLKGLTCSQIVPRMANYSYSGEVFSATYNVAAMSEQQINTINNNPPSLDSNFWYLDVGSMYDCQLFIEDVISYDLLGNVSIDLFFNDSCYCDLLVDNTLSLTNSSDVVFDFVVSYEYMELDGTWSSAPRSVIEMSPTSIEVRDSSTVSGSNTGFKSILDYHGLTFMRCEFDNSYILPLIDTVSLNLPTEYIRNVRISCSPSVDSSENEWIYTQDSIPFYIDLFGYYPVADWGFRYIDVMSNGAGFVRGYFEQSLIDSGVDSDVGSDWFTWLGNAVGGVLDVEILPNVSFTLILYSIVGLCTVFVVLKYFVGG